MPRYVDAPDGEGGLTWWGILQRWALVELDLHERFGIDMGDDALLRSRSWPWLRRRIVGLVSEPGTRLQRSLFPDRTPRFMYPPDKANGPKATQ